MDRNRSWHNDPNLGTTARPSLTGVVLRQGAPRLKRVYRQFAALLICIAIAGCAVQAPRPVADARHLDQQSLRIADATRQLESLEAVDLLLELDNAWLEPILRDRVNAGMREIPGWSSSEVDLAFFPGYVALDVTGRYELGPGNTVRVALAGDLVPFFQPQRLLWQVDLHELVLSGETSSPESTAGDGNIPEIPPEEPALIEALEASLRDAMARNGLDAFDMDALPLGILETGVRMRAPFQVVRAETSPLSGLLTVAGAAPLVTPGTTRLAIDLGFIPERPDCAPGVSIGRALFASDVRNREPVDPASNQAMPNDVRVFFTDVLETREPTTVIHYWFADGRPASVVELEIGPSARWRTWSAAPLEPRDVERWQVLVLEKNSGCVLAQETLELEHGLAQGVDRESVPAAFDALDGAFRQRLAGLGPTEAPPAPVRLAIDRSFFAAALSESMYDLRLKSTAAASGMPPLRVDARVGATPTDMMTCARERCESKRVCSLNYDNCPIQRDTRDCSSCLIRNPLNNRCMREAEDPICLAARDSENERLETLREACITRETNLRDACLRERDRELAACQRRATLEVSSCAAQVDEMAARHQSQRPLATIEGDARLDGQFDFEFGEFRLDEDLQRLQMLLSINARLAAEGTLAFTPAPDLDALGRCFPPISEAYDTTLSLAPWQGGLVTNVATERAALVANWSGLLQRLEADPPPVAEFFSRHESRMASCEVGLDPEQLVGGLSGSGTELLRGIVDLDLQPEPTRITLLPAHVSVGDSTWTGEAGLGADSVVYRLETRLEQDQAVTTR